MDFPFQTSADRQAQIDRLIKQINQQTAAIDQLVSRVEQVEGKCQQLYEYVMTSKMEVFRNLITELYNFRVVDVYRSFFSRDYFVGSVQQALGYWHQAQNMEIDEKTLNKFIVIYLTRLVNDFSIARGNVANYIQSVSERIGIEERLAFANDKALNFVSIDKMIGSKHDTLKHEKADKNNVLYIKLWQQIEPLFLPLEDLDLLGNTLAIHYSFDDITKLINSIERIFKDNGILICYAPSELPPDMMRPNYFEQVNSVSEQKPLIIRKEDNYMYTKGYVVNINS